MNKNCDLASSAPCSRDDRYHGSHDGDPKELVPDLNQAKFFALGAKFLMLQRLCLQDLSYKARLELSYSYYTTVVLIVILVMS